MPISVQHWARQSSIYAIYARNIHGVSHAEHLPDQGSMIRLRSSMLRSVVLSAASSHTALSDIQGVTHRTCSESPSAPGDARGSLTNQKSMTACIGGVPAAERITQQASERLAPLPPITGNAKYNDLEFVESTSQAIPHMDQGPDGRQTCTHT
jgi:hypothetical protein